MSKTKPFQFEKALAELEAIVENMEQGEFSLDKTLKQFEQGIKLSRECTAALKTIDQSIKKLVSDNNTLKLEDFEIPEVTPDA